MIPELAAGRSFLSSGNRRRAAILAVLLCAGCPAAAFGSLVTEFPGGVTPGFSANGGSRAASRTWPGQKYERVRYAGENAKGWIVELDELRAYAARATRSRGT